MVAIAKFLLFAASVSALVTPRSASSLLDCIANIDDHTKSLAHAVTAYNGGKLGAAPLRAVASRVEHAIQYATSEANSTPQLSSSDSKSIMDAIQNLLPHTQDSMEALKDKKQKFKDASLNKMVRQSLEDLQADTEKLGNSLIVIASEEFKQKGKDAMVIYKQLIDNAIRDFQ